MTEVTAITHRREAIHERYSDLIVALYSGASHCDSEIQVKYQDGSISQLSTRVSINRVETAS